MFISLSWQVSLPLRWRHHPCGDGGDGEHWEQRPGEHGTTVMFEKVGLQIRCFHWEFQQTDRQTDRQTSKQVMKEMKVLPIEAKSEGSFNFRKVPQVISFWGPFGIDIEDEEKTGTHCYHFCCFPLTSSVWKLPFFRKQVEFHTINTNIKGFVCRPTATFWIVKTLWTVYCKEIKPYRESQNRPKVLWISWIFGSKNTSKPLTFSETPDLWCSFAHFLHRLKKKLHADEQLQVLTPHHVLFALDLGFLPSE